MSNMVLFHKTPATWNKSSWLTQQLQQPPPEVQLEERPMTDGVRTLVLEDLYIQMCLKLKDRCGINHIHIVQGYENSEEKNWFVEEQEGTYAVNDSITYWSIGDLNHLLTLPSTELVFSRGNYPHLHAALRERVSGLNAAYWMHYPATSVPFPHLEDYKSHVRRQSRKTEPARLLQKLVGMSVEHKLQSSFQEGETPFSRDFDKLIARFDKKRQQAILKPYDAVLVDDVPLINFYQTKYPAAEIIPFHKPCLHPELALRHHRKHDLMFCGTTLQATKNHMQFLDFLFSIDQVISSPLDVAIVGNQGSLPAFSEGLRRNFLHLRITDYGEVSRQRLADLFNDTRNVIVTSGRDSNPRIIQEAGICGARVLAVDTLSDGLTMLRTNPILGAVLESDKSSWYYQKNGNLMFDVTNSMVSELLKEMELSRHPGLTASVAAEQYAFDTVVERMADRFNLQLELKD